YLTLGLQLDLGDLERVTDLVDMDLGGGVDRGRWGARPAQHGGKRHREAAGMGRGDQLLRIGAGGIPEARRPGKLPVEGTAAELHVAAAILDRTLPFGFR